MPLQLEESIGQALLDRLARPSMQLVAVVTGVCSPVLSYGLETLVEATERVCLAGATSSFEEFLQFCSRSGRCIALADPQLGGESIAGFLDELARHAPQAMPLLIVSATQPQMMREALRKGVRGLVSQSAGIDEISSALQAVAEGRRYISARIATLLADSLAQEDLTRRELQVLGLLSQGWCNKTIARDLDVAVGTVKTHVRAIMVKLGSTSRIAAIVEGSRRGLVSFG